MRMILGIADASRVDAVESVLKQAGAPGYTRLPVIFGEGRTGGHAGDRVHPGALVLVFAIVEDAAATPLFETLVRQRDHASDRVTRFFLLPVERQA